MKKYIQLIFISIFFTLFFSGCVTVPNVSDRMDTAERIAKSSGLVQEYIKAGDFTLMAYRKTSETSDTLRIYIEGDGKAWKTKYRISDDPTPVDPVALRLASIDNFENIVYIARPGQYFSSTVPCCDNTYWSERRFSEEVINSFDKAIDILKKQTGAKKIELIGYSGGAAIAVILAERRKDIVSLRSVAGNLNSKLLCDHHNVSYLEGSLEPLDVAERISYIPQRHFSGENDKKVPHMIIETFVEKQGDVDHNSITVVQKASHTDGWKERWVVLLCEPLNINGE